MAHNLNFRHGRAAMMYVGDTPWHELGTKLPKLATSKEAIEAAQLDFTVKLSPVIAKEPDREASGYFATYRTDTSDVLGIVRGRYNVIQNTEAFTFFDAITGAGEAMFETAGALGKGQRIWIMAKLPSYIKVGKGDEIKKYLLLTSSHDGLASVRIKFTPVRVVCENTLSVALSGNEREIKVRHTANAIDKLEQAHKLLEISNTVFEQIGAMFTRMTQRKMSDAERKTYVNTIIPDSHSENSARTDNMRDQIMELVEAGAGQQLETAKGTLWGAYNGVTEYVDHVRGANSTVDKRLASIWFGSGEQMKLHAFELATKLMKN